MTRVCIVGNIGLDVLFPVTRMPESHEKLRAETVIVAGGGAPANVAHWLARLGHEVRFHAVTGTDPLSDLAVDSLARVGVDVSGVRRHAGLAPSIATILTNGPDKRMVVSGQPPKAEPLWRELVKDLDFTPCDHVHTTALLHRYLFAGGRRADLVDRPVSADLNGRYSAQLVADLDFCFTNYDEFTRCTGATDIAQHVAADLSDADYHLVVTHAAEDVACYQPGSVIRVKPQEVAATDRSGAGDAFCAGYLHAIWTGRQPDGAIRAGLKLAAAVLSAFGCRPATSEVDDALAALSALIDRNENP
jgi:sugar/nucleoside kinase (ribokinase family)